MQMNACSSAVAHLHSGSACATIHGDVQFQQKPNGVLVTAYVTGLPDDNPSGFFAFHIHEGNRCCGKDFADTGSHYTPDDQEHPNHAGDLPPLLSCDGTAYLSVLTDRFCLRDVIGRTVVIHSMPDDFTTQPSGNAGKKIACGVICGG